MYAAITHVDKQSFPFSDVLRACFYEIANHAKINGAKGVSLIAGNIFCKTVQMHSVFSSACSYADVCCAFIKGRHNRGARTPEDELPIIFGAFKKMIRYDRVIK